MRPPVSTYIDAYSMYAITSATIAASASSRRESGATTRQKYRQPWRASSRPTSSSSSGSAVNPASRKTAMIDEARQMLMVAMIPTGQAPAPSMPSSHQRASCRGSV
jgi:hypothetical protein